MTDIGSPACQTNLHGLNDFARLGECRRTFVRRQRPPPTSAFGQRVPMGFARRAVITMTGFAATFRPVDRSGVRRVENRNDLTDEIP